jgi:hypothetical protein
MVRAVRLLPGMPFKHASRRRHILKARYRVANWPASKAGLQRRGDVTFWLDKAVLAGWQAPSDGRRADSHAIPTYDRLKL